VAEIFAKLFGRSFLPFAHFAGVDHHIMRIALSLDLDLAKFHQSRLHISMFRWLEFQGKRRDSKIMQPFDQFALRAARNRLQDAT
jgi:hypothetical protein